jgi:hypothetical protein
MRRTTRGPGSEMIGKCKFRFFNPPVFVTKVIRNEDRRSGLRFTM